MRNPPSRKSGSGFSSMLRHLALRRLLASMARAEFRPGHLLSGCRRSANRHQGTAANQTATTEFAEQVATHRTLAVRTTGSANPERTHSAIVRHTNCLRLGLRGSRNTKPCTEKLLERSATQRATHVQRHLFSISSTQTRLIPRDERLTSTGVCLRDILLPLMMLARLAVGLEPLNALDAAHRSPRF